MRGDPTQSIECLRRAVHFAPPTARDIGYVGLANVLLRQKFLSEAVIMARAALDDHSNSVRLVCVCAHVCVVYMVFVGRYTDTLKAKTVMAS